MSLSQCNITNDNNVIIVRHAAKGQLTTVQYKQHMQEQLQEKQNIIQQIINDLLLNVCFLHYANAFCFSLNTCVCTERKFIRNGTRNSSFTQRERNAHAIIC